MTEDSKREQFFGLLQSQTLLDPTRLDMLLSLASHCLGCTEGHYVECGVYRGGSAILMAQLLVESGQDRTIALLDAWQGMPAHTENDGEVYLQSGSLGDADFESVRKLVQLAGVESHTTMYPGWFEQTLPLLNAPFGFVHLDADYYQSTVDCLGYFLPRMSRGGICVVDDYGTEALRRFPGIKKAILEILQVHSDWEHSLPYGERDQAVFLYRASERELHLRNSKIAGLLSAS